MSAAGDASGEAALPLAADAAATHRLRGNTLFKAGSFAAAIEEYTRAVSLAQVAASVDEAARDLSASSDLSHQLVACLVIRATCAIKLDKFAEALDNTYEAIDACFSLAKPDKPCWQRALLRADWVRGSYLKAVLRRAEAAELSGCTMLASYHVQVRLLCPPLDCLKRMLTGALVVSGPLNMCRRKA